MKSVILVSLFLVSSLCLRAQPDNPNNPTPLPGIALLVAAGAAFGAKRIYDTKKG